MRAFIAMRTPSLIAQKLANISIYWNVELHTCSAIQHQVARPAMPAVASSCLLAFNFTSTILYHVFYISCHAASGCPVSVVSEPCGLSENGWRDTSVPSSLKAVVSQPAATIKPCWYPSPCEHLHLSCTKACMHKS